MANNPRIDIGIRVDYKDVLEQMKSSFKKELTEISNHARKTSFDADIEKKLKQIDTKVDSTFGNFEKRFDELSNQTITVDNFEKYQKEATDALASVKRSVTIVKEEIAGLRTEVGMLSGADFASDIKRQFDEMKDSLLGTCQALGQMIDLARASSGVKGGIDASALKDYKATLAEIRKAQNEIDNLDFSSSNDDDLFDRLSREEELLNQQMVKYRELKTEMSSVSESTPEFSTLENRLLRVQSAISKTTETIQALDEEIAARNLGAGMEDDTSSIIESVKHFDGEIDDFVSRTKKMIQATKEAQQSVEQTQTAFNTFQIKNGAIHVPVEVATKSGTLQKQLQEMVEKLQEYTKNNPVIAHVKLVLDKNPSKGYEKNEDIDKQQVEGQKEEALDISKTIQNTYRKAAREAKQIVKTEIKKIQEEFENVPVKIKPDTDAFEKEVSAMVNDTLEKIAKESSGINVNNELEKLVTNLKEVSKAMSGNESFKFGLDEDSINAITKAIQNMADMIQRAFGVASNDEIDAQWGVIESKFKAIAGEKDVLPKRTKEQKAAVQELAVEYKKYLNMGGKEDLSKLTANRDSIRKIRDEYEKLGKAAQDAAQKQEKVQKKPNTTNVSSEEAEALNAISGENKKLAKQAGKTGTALDNESKVAQTAAERFAELTEKKKAATEANLDLGIAAEMTTQALKEEMAALKEAEQRKKSNKKAVDESTYESNAPTWQKNIKQSLLDGGSYEEVYGGQLSRLESGVVKYTASVRDSEGAWKKLTATINSSGDIQSTKLQDLTEKQILKIEKEKEAVARMLEQMTDEGAEPIRLNRDELERYANDVKSVLQGLEKSKKATYTVNLGSDGKLSITRKEISKTGAEVKSFTAVIDNVEDVFNKTSEGMVVSARKLKESLKSAFDGGNISKSTKDLAAGARKAFDVFKEKAIRDDNFSTIESDLENLRQRISSIKTSNDLVKFNQDLKDLGVTLKNVGKDNKLGEILGGNKSFKDINEVRANIDSLFASMGKVNEKSIRITGTDKLTAEVKSANGEIRKMAVSLDSKGFARFVDKGIVEFGRLRKAAEGVFKGIQSMVRIYLSPQDFIRYFRQGFDAVREIDTAMTELKKVSDAPMGDIVAYFDDATQSAKKLGSTVEDMISATADWSRLGYNLPDSRELGEVAVLYKNVGDGIDIDTANESLVSTIQGFRLQAKDAMAVIDSFNEVSNNYAISSAGIGEALKRSAAAFNAANTDLNQSIALITAGNEIVQSPEKVGTMWQTVSARIRGTKTELEELGESTDDVLSTSKLQALVKGYTGVDIMKDKDTYKDIYTIISEIGEKWQDLKDVQRAALLEGLAGKKQSNTLAAVLNNADRLKEIYETAEGSAGSAQREQERYAQSIQYSLDQLTAHGEEFWNTFINKDDVKDFIDLINTLISGATKLVDVLGSIPTVAGILGGFASIKNVGRPKMFGLVKYCFELPTTTSVLSDTKVFLWSVVKYTIVNAR